MIGPVIVTGIQRSGTTLLGRIVASHPGASFTVNGKILYGLLHWMAMRTRSHCELAHVRADEILHMLKRKPILGVREDFVESVVAPEIHHWAQALAADRATVCGGDPEAAIRNLMHRIHVRLNSRAAFWGDKYNEYLLMAPQIRKIFPEARFVVIARDIDAVAHSMCRAFAGRPWCPPSHEHAVLKCREWQAEWEAARSGLPTRNTLEMRYEDLLRQPRESLQVLASFLGLTADAFEEQCCWIRSGASDLPAHRETVYG